MEIKNPQFLSKPRLIIILNRFVIGGQAVDTIPLAWHLQSDFETLILYGEKEKDELEPSFLLTKYPGLRLEKIKALRRSINPFIDFLAFIYVYKAISTFKADIVHTHGAKSGFIGRLASWIYGVPVIIHTFHGHFFHSYFSKSISRFIAGIERLVGKITTAAVALSNAQKVELAHKYNILPAVKIKVIPLGFAFDQENNADVLRNTFRNKFGLQDQHVATGIVGRIVPVKNHLFFVKVIEKIMGTASMDNAVFFIVGDGDLKQQVELELKKRNIGYNSTGISQSNKVVFTSWVTDMYEVMNGLDIVALTSLNEGTPLSVIEAQFFKKPVVSTDAGGVRDTMQDGIGGYVSATNDEDGFKEKLATLIMDAQLRKDMGEAGFDFASTRFSKTEEVNATRSLYFSLLRQRKNLQ